MKLLRAALCIGFGAIILMAPAAFNRSPFVFYDTSSYLELGRSISTRLPVIANLTAREPSVTDTSQQTNLTMSVGDDKTREHASLSYAGGRSPYYSFFIYVLIKLGGLWSVVILQALLAASLLWAAYALLTPTRSAFHFFFGIIVLAALSALPFYVDMVMPDVFAGLALLALGILTLGFDLISVCARIGLIIVITGAASTHATIPIICAVGLACFILTQFLLGRSRNARNRWDIVAWGTSPIILAAISSVLFFGASQMILGAGPQSPPYLMARVLADGTGRRYLSEACHPVPKYCRTQLPQQ